MAWPLGHPSAAACLPLGPGKGAQRSLLGSLLEISNHQDLTAAVLNTSTRTDLLKYFLFELCRENYFPNIVF